MKKIFLFLFLIYSYSFSENYNEVSNPLVGLPSCSFFTINQTGAGLGYWKWSSSSVGSTTFVNSYYSPSGAFVSIYTARTCNSDYTPPDCTPSLRGGVGSGVVTCENGQQNYIPNPDPSGSEDGGCNQLFVKDGVAYSCNPNNNEATPIPNSDGIEYDPENDEYIPKCNAGYEVTNSLNMSADGTTVPYKTFGCSAVVVTPPTDSGSGTTGDTSGTGSTGDTSGTGGTSGTGSTGGTTGGTTGDTSGTGSTTGGTSGTGTTGGTTPDGADSCTDSNMTLSERELCKSNSKLTTANAYLKSIDTSLASFNSNLQNDEGKSYLEIISDFVTTLTTPVTGETKSSYSNQINTNVTNALTDTFTKYSNVLGFGSSYGNRPENITLTLLNQEYTLIDFSLLDPFVSIIRSIFLTLAYFYGFMNLLRGEK